MNLVRLARHQHPHPPQRELRQSRVFDSAGRYIGDVTNLYVDDNRKVHFVDVVSAGFLGLGRKHHLVPAEAITDETPGSVTLGVEEGRVQRAPTLANPQVGPEEEVQRAVREHYGYG